MKKGKLMLLVFLVISLCLFLTGCFDASLVMKIKNEEGEGNAIFTVTTPSEEAFELIKSSAYKEDIIGPDQPDSIQSTIREERGVYSLEVKKNDFQLIQNTDVEVNREGNRITYTLEDIIYRESDDTSQEEEDMDVSSWFEGFSYTFTSHLPNEIQKAWWVDSEHYKLEEVESNYIEENTLSFEIPMDKLMSEKNKGKWADRWGVLIQTEK